VLDEHHVRATAPRGVNTSKTMLRGGSARLTPCPRDRAARGEHVEDHVARARAELHALRVEQLVEFLLFLSF
jgi:hypothetical protein